MARFSTAFGSISVIALSVAFASPALADMGRSPGNGAPGWTGSLEGGYLYQNGDDLIGYGYEPAAGTTFDVLLAPENGWFGGVSIGYNSDPSAANTWFFHRVEGYAVFGQTSDDASDTAPPGVHTLLTDVDATNNLPDGLTGNSSVKRRSFELGLRFERDQVYDSGNSITWVLAPFLASFAEKSDTSISVCCVASRSSDVDSRLFGIYLAAEPEYWFNSSVAIVGRGGVGVYGYSIDGKFKSEIVPPLTPAFNASVLDDKNGVGFRGLLGIGLKFNVSDISNLETFAEAEYYSRVGSASLPSNVSAAASPASVNVDDLWDVRLGARLNLKLN